MKIGNIDKSQKVFYQKIPSGFHFDFRQKPGGSQKFQAFTNGSNVGRRSLVITFNLNDNDMERYE